MVATIAAALVAAFGSANIVTNTDLEEAFGKNTKRLDEHDKLLSELRTEINEIRKDRSSSVTCSTSASRASRRVYLG